MIEFDFIVEKGDWPKEADLHKLCEQALHAAIPLLETPLPEGAEVSFLFTDNAHVQALNGAYRDQDKPTNVLSFAGNEGDGPITPLLGDIVLALETVKQEAEKQNKPFGHHLTHLLVHGFLHLLGYDHVNREEAEIMEALEVKILSTLCIDNPYITESAENI